MESIPDTDPDPDPNRGTGFAVLSLIMMILPTIAITLRVWSRLTLKSQRFWWDDWFAIASLVCALHCHQIIGLALPGVVLTCLSKALRACIHIYITTMGLGRAWSPYKSTQPGEKCSRAQVPLCIGLFLRPWDLTA